MTSGFDISVVILNWNTERLLRRCIASIKSSTKTGVDYEIIVVDNASEDGSRAMVTSEFPDVKLVTNKKNIGFGAGNNRGAALARGRYILFLNSDTEMHEDCLLKMMRYADEHLEVGIIGPKLLNTDGSLQYSCRHYPNLATGFFRNTPLGRLFPANRHNSDYLMSSWDHATNRNVDWVSGAALMIRRETANEVGMFDEDYFMYCEDVDLCRRVNMARRSMAPEENWKVTYVPSASITHFIGRSSDKVPTRMTYEFHRSQYLFYRKHYLHSTPIVLRPLIPVGIIMRALGQLIRYRVKHILTRLRQRQHAQGNHSETRE